MAGKTRECDTVTDNDDTTTTDPAETAGTEGSSGAGESSSTEGRAEGQSTSGQGTSGTGESESPDNLPDWARRKLAEANREAAKFRKERNDARKSLDDKNAAELSEKDREKLRADTAEAKLHKQQARVQAANLRVSLADSKHNFVDIETASLLLQQRGVEFDEDGSPQDIDSKLDTLVKDKPFLIGGKAPKRESTGSTNGGAGNEDEGSPTLTADELAMAKSFRLSPEEYQKYKNNDPLAQVKPKEKATK